VNYVELQEGGFGRRVRNGPDILPGIRDATRHQHRCRLGSEWGRYRGSKRGNAAEGITAVHHHAPGQRHAHGSEQDPQHQDDKRSETRTPHGLVNITQGTVGVKFWRCRDRWTVLTMRGPPARLQVAPSRPGSDLRELAGLDQINQYIPFVLLEDGEIAGFADADLVTGELHFRALPTPCWAQQHFPIVQCVHLLPLTIFRRSM